MLDGSRVGSPTDDERAEASARIAGQPCQDEHPLVDWLIRLCVTLAVDPSISGAAITLAPGTGTGTGTESGTGESVAAASDDDSRHVAELGFGLGEGPAHDSLRSGRPVLVPTLGGPHQRRWPGYSGAAADLGVRGVFCFPLQVGAVRFGVLSVFSGASAGLDRDHLSLCLTMAELATERLLDSGHVGDMVDDLGGALGLRDEIYQAQGMVAVALRVDLAEALSRMRGHAFQSGRSLLAVSLDIVTGHLRLTDDRPTA